VCGRFGLETPEFSETRFSARVLPGFEDPELFKPRYNIAPSQDVLAVAIGKEGDRVIRPMRWGLVSSWSVSDPSKPRPINLKSETLLERSAYRSLLAKRRCIIPSSWFYEWQARGSQPKQPYAIGRRDWALFGFAGLWDACKIDDEWLISCTILTTAPNDLIAPIHNRMPVILQPEHEALWLASDAGEVALMGCLAALPVELMTAEPVSSLVNDVKNDGPELRQAASSPADQHALPLF